MYSVFDKTLDKHYIIILMVNDVAIKQSSPQDMISMLLTPKEAKQIEIQRSMNNGKLEVHLEQGRPTRLVNLRDYLQL